MSWTRNLIALLIALTIVMPSTLSAKENCDYLGGISYQAGFKQVIDSEAIHIAHLFINERVRLRKLTKCEIAAGIFLFYTAEEKSITSRRLLAVNMVTRDLENLPEDHIYLKIIREIDSSTSSEDRAIGFAEFIGGVIMGIPALKSMIQ